MNVDWIKQNVTAGGTGNLTLGTAASSKYSTLAGIVPLGVYFEYQILDGNDREKGYGYLSASDTLVRSSIFATLVSGVLDTTSPTAITVTTSAVVLVSPSASNLIPAWPKPLGSSASERRIIGSEGYTLASPTNISLAANYLYVNPFYWRGGPVVGTVYAQVTTAAAGKFLRVGLFDISGGLSSFKTIIQTGAIATDSTGLVSGSVTPTLLAPGWYASGFISDGTPGVGAFTTSTETPFGWHATTATYKIVRMYKATTYGALADTIDMSSATMTNSGTATSHMVVWLGE